MPLIACVALIIDPPQECSMPLIISVALQTPTGVFAFVAFIFTHGLIFGEEMILNLINIVTLGRFKSL